MKEKLPNLAKPLVTWQLKYGRHDLPWQKTRDAYKVWVSEIMLQQTQVNTVRNYFERFMQRFPDVFALASASGDDVMGLWSGLGYYTRARNLHLCARQVCAVYAGVFPKTAQELEKLPGIGPSTAAAIASICFSERVAILDGNVKRVLTRLLGFEYDLSKSGNEKKLYQFACSLLPTKNLFVNMPLYTQGIMDLGATVCTLKNTKCQSCPVRVVCKAHIQNKIEYFPFKTRKIKRTTVAWWLLHAQAKTGEIFLLQRPVTGIWAGLYCWPLFESYDDLIAAIPESKRQKLEELPVLKHVLTHKDIHLHVIKIKLSKSELAHYSGTWRSCEEWLLMGLPAPVRKILEAGI